MQENVDQNNSEYGHFLRSVKVSKMLNMKLFYSIIKSSHMSTEWFIKLSENKNNLEPIPHT